MATANPLPPGSNGLPLLGETLAFASNPFGFISARRAMRFPVFHGGIGPLDTKGRARMVERDVPVECAGVAPRPGDIVFGDVDGVVVIPREREAEVIARAIEKVLGENLSRDALRRGELLGDVFRRLGIL